MKRKLSILLLAVLMICPCMAQASVLDADFARYTLTDAGISIELPGDWYVMTRELGIDSELARNFELTQEDVDGVLTASDVYLYALTDLLGTGTLWVAAVDGMDEPDMRNPDAIEHPDDFLNGYLLGMDGKDILEAGLYDSGSCLYARILCAAEDEFGEAYTLQYTANAAGKAYIIKYISSYGVEIDWETAWQIDSIVDSICFLDETAPAFQDKILICMDCGKGFVFTVTEQEFYAEMGFQNSPSRCLPCREARRNATAAPSTTNKLTMYDILCDGCGKPTQVPFQPRGDRPVYCSDCFNAQRGQ